MIKFTVTQEPFYEYGAPELLFDLVESECIKFIQYISDNLSKNMIPSGSQLERAFEDFHYHWVKADDSEHMIYFKFNGKPFTAKVVDGSILIYGYTGVAKYTSDDAKGLREYGLF